MFNDVTGTNSNDTLFFQGQLGQFTATLVNPYSGYTLFVDEELNINTGNYDGGDGTDFLLMSNMGDAFFINDGAGNSLLTSVEIIQAGAGGDVVNLADSTIVISHVVILGAAENDILWGNSGDDYIQGSSGDDNLHGGPGADYLDAGSDNDILVFNADGTWASGTKGSDLGATSSYSASANLGSKNQSYDVFDGGSGYDVIEMTMGNDVLFLSDALSPVHPDGSSTRIIGIEEINANEGDDVVDLSNGNYTNGVIINGGDGSDILVGSIGIDTINGDDGNDKIDGFDGNDILNGGAGNDQIKGGNGDDTISGDEGNDRLIGNSGDDTIYGGAGADDLDGNNGNDELFGGDGNDDLNGGLNDDILHGDQGDDVLDGHKGNDVLHGGDGADTLLGGDNDDILHGGDGNDNLNGGNHVDVLNGGNNDDVLVGGAGIDTLNGDDGNDWLIGDGSDILDGGSDSDILDYSGFGAAVNVDLNANTSSAGDTISNLENVEGTIFGDVLAGNAEINTLNGYDGDDTISGDGNNILDGGAGTDTLNYNGFGAGVIVDLKAGTSDAGDSFANFENLSGSEFDDTLTGDDGVNVVEGNGGNDTIYGGLGNDVLNGGAGNDVIYGGDGSSSIGVFLDKEFTDPIVFPGLLEGKNIKLLKPPGDPSLGVVDGNLDVGVENAQAEITFRKGFAGYNNSLGVYSIAEDGTIQSARLLWENVKDAGKDITHVIDLPTDSTTTEIGFFIIANGDVRNQGYRDADDTGVEGNIKFYYDFGGANERIATVYDDGDDIVAVYDDGVTQEVLKGPLYHTTERDGSNDLNPDEKTHVLSGLMPGTDGETGDVLRIGFEDLPNTGDADYEDVLFDFNVIAQETPGSEGVVSDDVLIGGAGDDVIYGEGGDDILIGGDGNDDLYGGFGSDTILYDLLVSGVDTIFGFETGEGGDVINITEILEGFDSQTDNILDFVHLTDDGNGNDVLEVNVDGDAGGEFAALAIIEGGVGSDTLVDLIDNGNLVVDQSVVI